MKVLYEIFKTYHGRIFLSFLRDTAYDRIFFNGKSPSVD